MDCDFEVLAKMPQEKQTGEGPMPPDLAANHVFLTHGDTDVAKDWGRRMSDCLQQNGFKTATLNSSQNATPQIIATLMRNSLKVVMLIDRDYLKSEEYQITIRFVEQMTGERQKEILVPVLSSMEFKDLPHELQFGSAVPVIGLSREYPKAAEQNWTEILSLITKETPLLSTITNGVACGLAWGYFFGYLHMILPGLAERIKEAYAAESQDWDCCERAQLFTRMMMIIPKSVRVLSSLSEYDSDIEIVKSRTTGEPIKVKHTIDFPGHPKRDYSCTMFKTKVNEREYLFFAEVPLTLNTLAKMRDSDVVEFSENDHKMELTRFQASLEGILTTHRDKFTSARLNNIKIMNFDDKENKLSDMIALEINGVLAWEKTPWKPIAN